MIHLSFNKTAILSERQLNYPTKFQKFICNLIGITPQIMWDYTLNIYDPTEGYYNIRNVLMDNNGNKWIVVSKKENWLHLKNVKPVQKFVFIDSMVLIFSAAPL